MVNKERPTIRPNAFIYSTFYTFAWFMIPITVYCSETLFARFCSFHKRNFRLEGKSQRSILGLAVLVSLFYSSISINLYYAGLLKIIGINSINDIEGIISDQFIEEIEELEEEETEN